VGAVVHDRKKIDGRQSLNSFEQILTEWYKSQRYFVSRSKGAPICV
jgi:hypothetical protein